MYCARIDHFVRFNSNNTIGKCGHMVDAPGFDSWQEMQESQWLSQVRDAMKRGYWPIECRRCQHSEQVKSQSIRQGANQRDRELKLIRKDYLILGGVLDNICNSACQSCNDTLSTKIGSLIKKDYLKIDNQYLMDRVPRDRVVEIDLNGGEPTASPNYQKLLESLPNNVHVIRVNTNGSRVLPNLEKLLDKQIRVIITLSLDGTGLVHDYVRWPIQWTHYQDVVESYTRYRDRYHNLELQAWTTVHALNVADWCNIVLFAKKNRLNHSWAWLEYPRELNARYSNLFTISARELLLDYKEFDSIASGEANQDQIDHFIQTQDQLRKINIKDYI